MLRGVRPCDTFWRPQSSPSAAQEPGAPRPRPLPLATQTYDPPFSTRTDCLRRTSVRKLLPRKLFPGLDVGNSLLIALDHHFGALFKRLAILAPRTCTAARACERKNNFAGAVLANGHAYRADGAFHPVVLASQWRVRMHQLHHELENDAASNQAGDRGNRQRRQRDQMRVSRQQVTGSAEPCQEGHSRRSVEPRDMYATSRSTSKAASHASSVMPQVKGQVHLEGEMDVDRTREK